jgi:hypothetical protein
VKEKATSKPGRRPSRGVAAGWTKRESTIALVSVVVSAISVLIAAVSAGFSYQQLRMLNRERTTPYRAILYSARADHFANIVRTTNHFFQEVQTAAVQEIEDSGGERPETNLEFDADAVRRVQQAFFDMGDAVTAGEPLWPDGLGPDFNNLTYSAYQLNLCFRHGNRDNSDKRKSGSLKPCTVAGFSGHWEQFEDRSALIIEKLGSHLHRDELGSIMGD